MPATLQDLHDELKKLDEDASIQNRDFTDDEARRANAICNRIDELRNGESAQHRSKRMLSPVAPVIPRYAASDHDDAHERAVDAYMRTGALSPEIVQYRAQSVGVGSSGGFTVPESFRNVVTSRMKAYGGIASGAEIIVTESGNPLPWATNDDTANSGEIVGEGATFAAGADLVFGTKTLQSYKFGSGGASNLPLKVSIEFLQDSAINVGEFISTRLGERIARAQSSKWAVGTGVNEPQGLLNATGGLGAATAWSSNTAPNYADLLDIVHGVDPSYRGDGCVWVFNDTVLKVLRGIVDLDGRPLLWSANESLAAGSDESGGLRLMGYPVIVDQSCPDPASGNRFGFFGSLKRAYVIRRVKDVTLVALNELYAANGQVGFLAWARADGCIQDVNAGVALLAA